MDEALPIVWRLKAFPALRWLLPLMEPLVVRANPNMKAFLEVRKRMESQIDELLKDPGLLDRADHEIVYHHLMTPQPHKGQHHIPSKRSLWHEVRKILRPLPKYLTLWGRQSISPLQVLILLQKRPRWALSTSLTTHASVEYWLRNCKRHGLTWMGKWVTKDWKSCLTS
jgi:hypothetical protein